MVPGPGPETDEPGSELGPETVAQAIAEESAGNGNESVDGITVPGPGPVTVPDIDNGNG